MKLNQCSRRIPWNKGKIVGQKAPLKLKEAWLFASGCSWQNEPRIWRCSTLASTVSCEPAIWYSFG